MARFRVSSVAMSGSASMRPPEKISPPAATSRNQPPAARGASATGKAWKLSASVMTTIRWPSTARKISMAITLSRRAMTMVLPPLVGSKKDAKDRPICRPTYSPAACTAANTMRIEKPIAAPMRTCWIRIQKPAADTSGTAGMAPSVGATTMASRAARPTLAARGTAASLKMGAVLMSASMRTKGQRKATIQRLSWSEVTEKTGGINRRVAGWMKTGCAYSPARC